MFENNITDTVKNILKDYIKEGDVVIDATLGNGNDTVFLAKQVGQTGKVYGFDIQELAISNTKEKLLESGLDKRVELIQNSHEYVEEYVSTHVQVAMFNLGYLPNGDKKIVTKPESTLKAIKTVLEIMNKEGVMSIVIYYGHDGGVEEKRAVEELLCNLNKTKYDVISISYKNRTNCPPITYLLRKK